MSLTDAEIGSLGFHLGYGNISIAARPYSPDNFYEVFNSIVGPYLSTGNETSATDAITAGSTTQVTPVAMTGIVAYGQLVIDTGDDAEIVMVKVVDAGTFTAAFTKAHSTSGYPISTMSGVARLRLLLQSADRAWEKVQDKSITSTAGLKQLGNGEIEWFGNNTVLRETIDHYRGIVRSISDLVRVQPRWELDGSLGRSVRVEAY